MIKAANMDLCAVRESQNWFANYGTISDVRGRLINSKSDPPLKLNVLQRRIIAVYERAKQAKRPCRVIGLKPRKKGFSTIVCALHYHQLRSHRHEGVIIGDQFETSDTVFRMAHVYLDHDKLDWGNSATYNSERVKCSHGSLMHQRTAKNKNTARGMTPQFVHGTEVAHWQNASPVLVSVMNAIDGAVFNAVFLESTPNGAQGSFYDNWENARWPTEDECPPGQEGYYRQWESMSPGGADNPITGTRGFVRVFAAWFEFEDSRIHLDERQKEYIRSTLDSEPWYAGERELIESYGQTRSDGTEVLGNEVYDCDVWEQLAWRRDTISTKCDKSLTTFEQEYPRDPTACFLSSGSRYFESWALAPLHKTARDPERGEIAVQEGVMGAPGKAVWNGGGENSPFMRWEHPIVGAAYLMSVDPAVGADQVSNRNDDPDQHSALVWRRAFYDTTGVYFKPKLVARVAYGQPGEYPIPMFAELCAHLSFYYGGCMVVPEMNNSGLAFILAAKALGVTIWRRQEYDPNKNGKKREMEGFQTSDTGNYGGVRTDILEYLRKTLRDGAVDIPCKHVLSELVTFVRHSNGKAAAATGKHDDDVMSTAIGLRTLDHATVYANVPVIRRIPKDLERQLEAATPTRTAENW